VKGRGRGAAIPVIVSAVVLCAGPLGCKNKESLVIVSLSADTGDLTATQMTSVSLAISDGSHAVEKIFSLPTGGIPSTAPLVTFGAYVDADVTGPVTITARASKPDGCIGESGAKGTKIDAAGDTAPPVTIGMKPDGNVCPPDGGLGGAGAATGGGGATGTGGSPGAGGAKGGATGTGGAPGRGGSPGAGGATGAAGSTCTGGVTSAAPTFAHCVEINHDDTAGCGPDCSKAQDSAVFSVAFSPKNSQLFVTAGGDGRVKVWRVSNGTATPQGKVLTGTGLGIVAFSPDGTLLAIGRSGGIEIWSVATWTLLRTLSVSYEVYGVAFSPDGTQVISIDYNPNATGTSDSDLYVHAVAAVQPLHAVAFTGAYALAVSPVSAAGSLPVAVTTETGQGLVFSLTPTGFSTPATLTITSDGSIAETAQFSPQGNLLAAGGDDGLLHFWSVPVQATAGPSPPDIDIFHSSVFSTETYAVAFSRSSGYVAVGGGGYYDLTGSGSLTAWAVPPPRCEEATEYDTINSYDVVSVTFAPDDSFIVAGEGNCGCVLACRQ
jgi:WD40 domain-containing protein